MLHFFSIWCTVLFGRPVYLGALLFVVNVTWTHKSVADFLIVYDVVAWPGRGRISYKLTRHSGISGGVVFDVKGRDTTPTMTSRRR